jgi:glycosyltransferase involved in cell wall biosynthesis
MTARGNESTAPNSQSNGPSSRVLILSLGYAPNVGGVETHLSDLVAHLSGHGVDVEVATLQPFTTPARGPCHEELPHLTIRRYQWIGQGWFFRLGRTPVLGFLYAFPAMLMVALRSRHSRADVIYPQGLAAGAASALVFRRRRRVIALHSDIEFSSKVANLAVRTILASASDVLCLSERVRAQVVALGIYEDRVHRFHNWVNVEHFRPGAEDHSGADVPAHTNFTVLFVGRLISEKGVDLALESARLLEQDNVTFLFAGTGPELGRVRQYEGSLSNVRCLGPVSQQELPALYSSADVFLMPSPSEEGFGRVLLEALACGTCVVATRRGGIPEVVTPEVGVLVEPVPEQIVAALRQLKNDPDALARMSANARSRAVREYSASNARMIERVLFA